MGGDADDGRDAELAMPRRLQCSRLNMPSGFGWPSRPRITRLNSCSTSSCEAIAIPALRAPSIQRRDALGRREQAIARVAQALIDEKFARERIVNEVTDARSAVRAAFEANGFMFTRVVLPE